VRGACGKVPRAAVSGGPGGKVPVFDYQKSQGQAVRPDEVLPMTGRDGVYRPNPRSEKLSRRREESIKAWRYMVLESDEAPAREWLGALVQLPLKIAAVYASGGRSVHALVRVDARTKSEWDAMKQRLLVGTVTPGADEGSLSAVRLTRLPGCWREPEALFQLSEVSRRIKAIRARLGSSEVAENSKAVRPSFGK